MKAKIRHPRVGTSAGLVPFVIGVTGHRDLREEDLGALRKSVHRALDQICEPLKYTPVLLLTALAEGADQLAAEVALELGLEIAAVFPMPFDDYLKTLSTDKARDTLRSLRKRAIHEITLPGPPAGDVAASPQEVEQQAYRRLANYLARHSHALIALWDGSTGEPGGTFEVLCHFHTGSPEHAHPEAAWAFTISTPRQRHTQPLAEPFAILRWNPVTQHSVEARYEMGLIATGIERFNNEAEKLSKRGVASESLFPTPYPGPSTPFLLRVDAVFRNADSLAVIYHKVRDRWIIVFLFLTMLPILGLEMHGDLLPESNELYFAYPVGFFLVWLLFVLLRRRDEQSRFPDFRVFAERLRIQFYWAFSGIHQPVNDHFEFPEDFEPAWISATLRSLFLFSPLNVEPSADNLKAVLHFWVISQSTWFKKKTAHQRKTLSGKEKSAKLFFVFLLTLALAVSLIATLNVSAFIRLRSLDGKLSEHLHFVIVMSTFALGLFHFWIDQAGLEELARSYYRMSQVFSRGAEKLGEDLDANNLQEAVKTIHTLGLEALRESSSWLIMRRERSIEIHL